MRCSASANVTDEAKVEHDEEGRDEKLRIFEGFAGSYSSDVRSAEPSSCSPPSGNTGGDEVDDDAGRRLSNGSSLRAKGMREVFATRSCSDEL